VPRKTNIKKVVRFVHLWLGLAAGLVLSVVGITGSVYVFQPEIDAYLEREYYKTVKNTRLFKTDIEIATFVETTSGEKIESIQWPKRGRDTYIFKFFNDDNWYYFDQSNGKLTKGGKGLGSSFFTFILDLHTSLTLGHTGRMITGTASLLFAFFMLTTGLYLWWPRTKTRRKISFKIRFNAKPKLFNYDLHNVNGFYFFIPLFLIGFTGAAFYYNTTVQRIVDIITFSEPAPEPIFTMKLKEYDTSKDFIKIEEVLTEMNRYYPDYYKRNLWMTDKPDGTLSLAYQKQKEVHSGPNKRIFLRADPYTGKILGERNPDTLPRGSSIMAKWLLPVHFGEFGGWFTRILWCIAGLMPALLTYTGVKIWLGKRKNRKKKPTKVRA